MAVPKQKPGVGAPALMRPRRKRPASAPPPNRLIARARRKFLRAFPGGFRDETYLDWERDYKWQAHLRWQENLSKATFRRLIDRKLLTHDETIWVDAYHGRVRAALTPLVDPQTKAWLDRATASLTGA